MAVGNRSGLTATGGGCGGGGDSGAGGAAETSMVAMAATGPAGAPSQFPARLKGPWTKGTSRPLLPGGRRAGAERVQTFSIGVGGGGGGADGGDGGGGGGDVGGGGGGEIGRGSVSGDRYLRAAAAHVIAFLRTALLMVHVCMTPEEDEDEDTNSLGLGRGGGGGGEGRGGESEFARSVFDVGMAVGADGTSLPSSDDEFLPLCRFFGFPESAEALLSQPGLVDAARRYDCVFVYTYAHIMRTFVFCMRI